MNDLDIVEVSRCSGLPASTLRLYEEKGLIASMGRRGLRRLFDPGVLEQLSLVALGRAAGFSLEDISGMFGPDGRPAIDRAKLAAKADELNHLYRKADCDARRAAPCSGVPGAEPFGMPDLSEDATRGWDAASGADVEAHQPEDEVTARQSLDPERRLTAP